MMVGIFANANPTGGMGSEVTCYSDQERKILDYTARGHTNTEIAEQLTIRLKTVRNHVSSIFNKLQVTNRAQDAGSGE